MTSAVCDGSIVTVTRTYSVTDCSGNSINVTQLIYVDDVTNPTASNPADIHVECFSAIPDPDVTVVTDEADNCEGVVTVAWVSDDITSAVCDGSVVTVTRTYSVTDCSGNSINVTQKIYVDDVTNPTASNPTDIHVECFSAIPDPDVTVVTDEADNCEGVVTVAWVSDDVTSVVCDGSVVTVTRTYSVTDCSGNSINVTQLIYVDDVTPPVITFIPVDLTVSCASAVPDFDDAAVIATDNCVGELTVTHNDVIISGNCVNRYIVERTYSVTDCSGNTSSLTQIITVNDQTVPTFTRPADITIYTDASCNFDSSTTLTGDVTDEADNCSTGLEATYIDEIVDGACPGTHIITRTWSLVDICGNSAEDQIQTITVLDNIAPTFTCPSSPQEKGIPGLETTYTTVGTEFDISSLADNCSSVTAVNNLNGLSSLAGYVFPVGSTDVTWTATDQCGNSSQCTFTVTVIQLIADLSIVKSVDNPIPNIGSTVVFTLTVTNNGPVTATGVFVNDLLPNGYTYISDDGSGAYVPSTGIWTIGSIANTGTAVLHITATVNNPGRTINYVNTADVHGNELDPAPDSNTSSITIAVLIAYDDYGTLEVNGFTGGSVFFNVLANDKLNDIPVNADDLNLTFISSDHPGISLVGSDVVVAPGTPAGNHELIYQICLKSQPANCDQALVVVHVIAPKIDAIPDYGLVNGRTGGTAVSDVLANDLLNGEILDPSLVTLSFVSSSNPNITLVGSEVIVAPGTEAGMHTLVYRICEILNPDNCDETTVTLNIIPGLRSGVSITKTVQEDSYSAVGDVLHYTIEVINLSEENIYNVTVSDPNAVVTSMNPIAVLNPASKATFLATHTVTQGDLDAGHVDNAASAFASYNDGAPIENTSSVVTVPGVQRPQVTATKFALDESYRAVGDIIFYSIEIFNCGNVTLTDLVISDPNARFVELDRFASLAPRTTKTFYFQHVVTQADLNAGKITNIATVKAKDPNGKPVTDESNEVIIYANQASKMVVIASAKETEFMTVGDTIHYEIAVKNFRATTMTEIVVGASNATITNGSTIVSLLSGHTANVSAIHIVTQQDLDAGSVSCVATARGKDYYEFIDRATSNEVKVFANQHPELSLVKTADETSYSKIGDLIHYSNVISNTGNVKITGLVLTDPNTIVESGNQVTSLNPGESVTIRTTYSVSQADLNVGFVEKTASVSANDPNLDPIKTSSNKLIITALQQAQLLTSLSAAENTYSLPGDVIHYSIEVRNTGNVTLTNVKVAYPDTIQTNRIAVGDLLPGSRATVSVEHLVTQADLQSGELTRSAVAIGFNPMGKKLTTTSNTLTIKANQSENLVVTLIAQETGYRLAGEKINYSIMIKNHGKVEISNISVTDPDAVINDPVIGNLPGSGVATLTASRVITQADIDGGSISNIVTITGQYPNGSG
jgi:uncharacterized repeat protein (TIGR01451 family)